MAETFHRAMEGSEVSIVRDPIRLGPFGRLSRAVRGELEEEAEDLAALHAD